MKRTDEDMDDFEDEFCEPAPKPIITGTVTTQQIQDALNRVHELATEEARIEHERKKITKLKMSAEALAVSLLEAANLEEFSHKELGKFKIKQKSTLSFKDVDKEAYYKYLKETGQFDGLATIHAKRFIGWYNDEYDRAVEEGRGMEFSVPGVPEPKIYNTLNYKKPKPDTES